MTNFLFTILFALIGTHQSAYPQPKIEIIPVVNTTTITAYTLSPDETDDDPCIGAGNNNLCELRKTKTICASRDLPLNTKVYIEGIGICEVLDRMNIRFKGTNRIDVLMDSKEEARKFGVKKLTYTLIK